MTVLRHLTFWSLVLILSLSLVTSYEVRTGTKIISPLVDSESLGRVVMSICLVVFLFRRVDSFIILGMTVLCHLTVWSLVANFVSLLGNFAKSILFNRIPNKTCFVDVTCFKRINFIECRGDHSVKCSLFVAAAAIKRMRGASDHVLLSQTGAGPPLALGTVGSWKRFTNQK